MRERLQHVQPHLVAIALLGPVGQVAQGEVGQPQLGKVTDAPENGPSRSEERR